MDAKARRRCVRTAYHLETATYRQENHQAKLLKNEGQLAKGMDYFQQAVTQKSIHLLGKAASVSAACNQTILPKPFWREIVEVTENLDLVGLNVSHSGTVVGILYELEKRIHSKFYLS